MTIKLKAFFGVQAVTIGLAPALSAAVLYTNTWNNTTGRTSTNFFGETANWLVQYESGVTPPASAVPTAESKTLMLKDAIIALQAGEERHLGTTYFLGAGTTFKTLDFLIPAGAILALDGTGLESYVGTTSWVEKGTRNIVTIDVDGGILTLGQSVFSLRGNTQAAWTQAPVNRLVVRNGGAVSVTNGYVRLWGGSSADSQGRGIYTNIIDVLEGSTLKLSNSGRIAFGSSHSQSFGDYNTPWVENYYGSGWVNVKGGRIAVENGSTQFPIVINGHANAGMPAHFNVTEGGVVDLGGKALYIGTCGTGVVTVAHGSVLTNGDISVQQGGGTSVSYHTMIDVNGGTAYLNAFSFGTSSGSGTGRMMVRTHGADSMFNIDRFSLHTPCLAVKPLFFDLRLKAHTDRNADFAVLPIQTRRAVYSGNGSQNQCVFGYWRLSPDGGFQLVHKKTFELLCRKHDGFNGDGSSRHYKFEGSYGGLVGDEMWATNVCTKYGMQFKRYTSYEYAYVFQVTLKDDARLTDGVALAEPKPRAWLQLPTLTAKEIRPDRMERVSVRIALAAPAGGTLDVDAVVRQMREEGGQNAVADDSVAGYNVRVDLPFDELKADTTDDRIVMDFVRCDSYAQVSGVAPMVTNALIRAATCEKVKKERGLYLFMK